MNESLSKSTEPQPRLWERLQLIVGDGNREGFYYCRICEINGNNMLISRPDFSHGHSLLANNRPVTVNYTRADATYSFTARIRECNPKSDREMNLIDLGNINRIQRRRFVRMEKLFNVGYKCIKQPVKGEADFDGEFRVGHCLNISAGGLLFEAKDKFELGDLVFLNFSFCPFENMPEYVMGIVRQSRERENHDPVCGVEFILREDLHYHFRESDEVTLPAAARIFDLKIQNELVNELFAEQMELRRKGLL